MVQLERIGATIEQRWSLKGKNGKKESRDDREGSKDNPRENQKKKTLSSASC